MVQTIIEFVVIGRPATAGSKRGFPVRRKDGSIGVAMAPDNKRATSWMGMVAQAARLAYQGDLLRGPLSLRCHFYFARPKCHYGTGKKSNVLKSSAPFEHMQKPDVTKCVRAVEDALTKVLWVDDSQVCRSEILKSWTTNSERAHVIVSEL